MPDLADVIRRFPDKRNTVKRCPFVENVLKFTKGGKYVFKKEAMREKKLKTGYKVNYISIFGLKEIGRVL